MNPIEKQFQLGRELMELNVEWFRKIAEFDTQNVQKYFEMNQTFAQRLPEVKDLQSFADLQREYGEHLWSNTQQVFETRNEMVREAFQANTDAVRSAFAPEAEEKAEKPAAKKAAA